MKRKGLAAMLDGLLAYTVAFLAIGYIALLLINTPEADLKKTTSLNMWAEDLADAVGRSMINGSDTTVGWYSRTDASVYDALNESLESISLARNMTIYVELDGTTLYYFGNLSKENTIATATRFLEELDPGLDLTGDYSTLKVKLGL